MPRPELPALCLPSHCHSVVAELPTKHERHGHCTTPKLHRLQAPFEHVGPALSSSSSLFACTACWHVTREKSLHTPFALQSTYGTEGICHEPCGSDSQNHKSNIFRAPLPLSARHCSWSDRCISSTLFFASSVNRIWPEFVTVSTGIETSPWPSKASGSSSGSCS